MINENYSIGTINRYMKEFQLNNDLKLVCSLNCSNSLGFCRYDEFVLWLVFIFYDGKQQLFTYSYAT